MKKGTPPAKFHCELNYYVDNFVGSILFIF